MKPIPLIPAEAGIQAGYAAFGTCTGSRLEFTPDLIGGEDKLS